MMAAKHSPVQHEFPGNNLVVGLGKSGLSMVRTLRGLGANVTVTDTRSNPPGLLTLLSDFPKVVLDLGGFDPETFAEADRIFLSPGVAISTPEVAAAKDRGTPVMGDIELFAQLNTAPVIAITGSNGKSTVTSLLGEMAKQAGINVGVGGNLGTPALDLLAESASAYVLELSSFQLETTHSLNAVAATVLNLSADHLDRYADMDDYTSAKRRIFLGNGAMILNADDASVLDLAEADRECHYFSVEGSPKAHYALGTRNSHVCLSRNGQCVVEAADMKMAGRHNYANALAALALGDVLGWPLEAMCKAIVDFPGLPHRTQFVARINDVNWYNDSKGTNTGATLAAVQSFAPPLVLIAGGESKDQDFTVLANVLAGKARAVVLIGRDAGLIEAAINRRVPCVTARSMDEAVDFAAKLAQPGDQVLLSPACASFDMFDHYIQRGEMFADSVHRLQA